MLSWNSSGLSGLCGVQVCDPDFCSSDFQTAWFNQLGHHKYFLSAKHRPQTLLYLESYSNGVANGTVLSDFHYSTCTITNVYYTLREVRTLESKVCRPQEMGFSGEGNDHVNSTEFEITMNFAIFLCLRFHRKLFWKHHSNTFLSAPRIC